MSAPERACAIVEIQYDPDLPEALRSPAETRYFTQVFDAHQQPTDGMIADGLEAARKHAQETGITADMQNALGKKAFRLLVQKSNMPTDTDITG